MKNNFKRQIVISDTKISSALIYKYNLKPIVYFENDTFKVLTAFDDDQTSAEAMNELRGTGTIKVSSPGFRKYKDDYIAELSNITSYMDHLVDLGKN